MQWALAHPLTFALLAFWAIAWAGIVLCQVFVSLAYAVRGSRCSCSSAAPRGPFDVRGNKIAGDTTLEVRP